eukprot:1372778-Pleurochrysis_carterae.AAC.2
MYTSHKRTQRYRTGKEYLARKTASTTRRAWTSSDERGRTMRLTARLDCGAISALSFSSSCTNSGNCDAKRRARLACGAERQRGQRVRVRQSGRMPATRNVCTRVVARVQE